MGPHRQAPAPGQPDPGLTAIISERRQLINLAYRLLGSLAEAEDAFQETYARWYALTPGQRDAIASPGAWLTTVTSRICLDQLGSARARRERYVGQWRGWLVLADPGRCGESSWRRGQRVAVPHQGDLLTRLTPACSKSHQVSGGSRLDEGPTPVCWRPDVHGMGSR